jgi:hypothetical protein
MTSKRKAATPSSSGAICKLLLADDFRLEQGGKVTALGLYVDGVIVIHMDEGLPDPTLEAPIAIEGISLLVAVSGLEGEHSIGMGLSGGNKDVPTGPVQEQKVSFESGGHSIQMITKIRPLLIGSLGIKHVLVSIDGTEMLLPFEVRRGVPPGAQSHPANDQKAKPRSKSGRSSVASKG